MVQQPRRFESQLSRMNLPDVPDRIELGRFRRQRQERDAVWDGKPLRDMPSRLIKKKVACAPGATASEISSR